MVGWTQGSTSSTPSTHDTDSAHNEKLLSSSQTSSTHSHSDSDDPGTPKTIPLKSLSTCTLKETSSYNSPLITSENTTVSSLSSTLACHQPPDAAVTIPNPFGCVWALEHVKPMLVWCMENADNCPTLHGYSLCDGYRYGTALYFPTAVKFTRWLFRQRRGSISPWCVLLTGWREAQPCAAAIAAARTGETSGLRLDARRPPLQDAEVDLDHQKGGAEVQVAVASMVVIPQQGRQEFNAMRWAAGAWEEANVAVHVLSSGKQASERLRSLASSFVMDKQPVSVPEHPCASFEHGASLAPPPPACAPPPPDGECWQQAFDPWTVASLSEVSCNFPYTLSQESPLQRFSL